MYELPPRMFLVDGEYKTGRAYSNVDLTGDRPLGAPQGQDRAYTPPYSSQPAYPTPSPYRPENSNTYRPERSSPFNAYAGEPFYSPSPYNSEKAYSAASPFNQPETTYNQESPFSPESSFNPEVSYSSESFDEGEFSEGVVRDVRSMVADPGQVERFLEQDSFSPTGSNPMATFEGFLDSEVLQQVGRVARGSPGKVEGGGEWSEPTSQHHPRTNQAPSYFPQEGMPEFDDPIFYPQKESGQTNHMIPKRGASPQHTPYTPSPSAYTPSPKPFNTPSYTPSPQPYVGAGTPGYPSPTTPSPFDSSPIPADYSPISYSAGDLSDFSSSPFSGPSFAPAPGGQWAPPGSLGPIPYASPNKERHRRFPYRPYSETTERRVEEEEEEMEDRVIFRGQTHGIHHTPVAFDQGKSSSPV